MHKTPEVERIYAECKTLEEVVRASCIETIKDKHNKWVAGGLTSRKPANLRRLHRMFEEQTRDFDVHSG